MLRIVLGALTLYTVGLGKSEVAPVTQQLKTPITIEALRDVEVRTSERLPNGTQRQVRGVLYSSKAFIIRKGSRFQMIRDLGEGECMIRFKAREYELSSCPWMDGFTDHQSDVYKVVPKL